MSQVVIFSDGGSRGNPGPAACAFVVQKGDKVIDSQSRYLGIKTNNFAEYSAVEMIVNWIAANANQLTDSSIIVNLDSQLVQRQLIGQYKVKDQTLKEVYFRIKKTINLLPVKIDFQWQTRDKNFLADQLVNRELDLASTGK